MDKMLDSLTERLKALPGQHITCYEGGALKVRAFPELGRDVEKLVRHLQTGGVTRGQRIGLLANNCYEWLVYDLALLHLGVIAVPLPVDSFGQTPRAEVAERYRLALLLVEPDAPAPAEHWVMRMRLQDPDPVRLRDEISAQPDPDKDLFSLVFSSGTSGRLKCLKISRRGTQALIASFGRDFQFRADDLILAFLPLSSFQQRWMLYTAIHYGFNLGLTVPARLFHALKDMRPTVLGAAPLLYETVEGRYLTLEDRQRRVLDVLRAFLLKLPKSWQLRAGRILFKPFHDPFGGRIRLAIAGAAPIRYTTLKFFESIGLTLYSAYGLTEAGFLSWNVPGRIKLGSVGKEVYPGTLELAEDGEIIFNYPDLLSYGYLDVDPEEERKTFLGKGRIATGDIGRVDADGYFYIEGRKKDIIITQGGVKLQPEDIERAIEREADVGRAVVFGGGDLPCVMALVSLRSGDSQRLRRRIQDHIDQVNRTLAPPARIGKVVFTGQQFTMESGFLNRNLKVDRNKVFGRFQADFMNMTTTGDAA